MAKINIYLTVALPDVWEECRWCFEISASKLLIVCLLLTTLCV